MKRKQLAARCNYRLVSRCILQTSLSETDTGKKCNSAFFFALFFAHVFLFWGIKYHVYYYVLSIGGVEIVSLTNATVTGSCRKKQ